MTENRGYRIIFDIVLLLCIGLAPWWATVVVGIVGALLFPRFYEILFVGAILDALYSPYLLPWTTALSLILFILLHYGRGILRIER